MYGTHGEDQVHYSNNLLGMLDYDSATKETENVYPCPNVCRFFSILID